MRATYIAECFWPDAHEEQVDQAAERVRRCVAELRSEEKQVDYTGSIFVPTEDVVFYLFDGMSAEAVQEVCERAAVPYERVIDVVHRLEEPIARSDRRPHPRGT